MGNTEGGRLHRFVQKQVYYTATPPILQTSCPPRTTLSTELTPAQSSRYTANSFAECVEGQAGSRRTYQGGVSQEQIQALIRLLAIKPYGSESVRLAAESAACPGYTPAFSSIIPPVPVCPPLPPPPAPPMIPGANPRLCINTRY
jgi:hypothetical protein